MPWTVTFGLRVQPPPSERHGGGGATTPPLLEAVSDGDGRQEEDLQLEEHAIGRSMGGGGPIHPIYIAIAYNNLKAVKDIIDLDAGIVHHVDLSTGRTALHVAAFLGRVRIGRLLVQSGAHVNAVCWTTALTPLHVACDRGNVAFVEALVECGAPIHVNRLGGDMLRTPLHYASGSNAPSSALFAMCRALLMNGACPFARDIEGYTALDLVREDSKGTRRHVTELMHIYRVCGCEMCERITDRGKTDEWVGDV